MKNFWRKTFTLSAAVLTASAIEGVTLTLEKNRLDDTIDAMEIFTNKAQRLQYMDDAAMGPALNIGVISKMEHLGIQVAANNQANDARDTMQHFRANRKEVQGELNLDIIAGFVSAITIATSGSVLLRNRQIRLEHKL